MSDPTAKRRKLTDLIPDARNANKGTERGLRLLDDSLREDGAGRGILLDRKGNVIAGNKTLERAVDNGFEEVIIVPTDGKALVATQRVDVDIDSPQGRRMALRDNRVGQVDLDWDADELQALANEGVDLSALWNENELVELLKTEEEPTADPGAQMDKAAELQTKWQVQPGDLWQIGKHRLLCGDSTKAEDVARVMGRDKACLLVTDPPYGVDFKGQKYNPIAKAWEGIKGNKRQGVDLEEWLLTGIALWVNYVNRDGAFYFWTAPMEEGAAAAAAIRRSGLHIQSQIIWVKNTLVLGQADYQWKHENCWYAFWKGKQHRWYGERDKTTVWEIDKIPNSAYMHPMQKPTELYALPMEHHTLKGEICLEPFAGSGSQYAAGEQLGRYVYGLEIEPKYCAVILERLSAMGLTPERL